MSRRKGTKRADVRAKGEQTKKQHKFQKRNEGKLAKIDSEDKMKKDKSTSTLLEMFPHLKA